MVETVYKGILHTSLFSSDKLKISSTKWFLKSVVIHAFSQVYKLLILLVLKNMGLQWVIQGLYRGRVNQEPRPQPTGASLAE